VADALGRMRPAPAQAFAIRTLLVHAYRRVRLRDPQLPREVLADDWPGAEAYALSRAIHRATHDAAEAHLEATAALDVDDLPGIGIAYARRFADAV